MTLTAQAVAVGRSVHSVYAEWGWGGRLADDAYRMNNTPEPASITREQAAQAIVNYFLTNAESGDHAANDELIAEMARRRQTAAALMIAISPRT